MPVCQQNVEKHLSLGCSYFVYCKAFGVNHLINVRIHYMYLFLCHFEDFDLKLVGLNKQTQYHRACYFRFLMCSLLPEGFHSELILVVFDVHRDCH